MFRHACNLKNPDWWRWHISVDRHVCAKPPSQWRHPTDRHLPHVTILLASLLQCHHTSLTMSPLLASLFKFNVTYWLDCMLTLYGLCTYFNPKIFQKLPFQGTKVPFLTSRAVKDRPPKQSSGGTLLFQLP